MVWRSSTAGRKGQYDRLPGLATELARRPVAVIVATGTTAAALAAKACDRYHSNHIHDRGRCGQSGSRRQPQPAGRECIRGQAVLGALGAKRLELLRAIVPAVAAVGVLVNPDNPIAAREEQDVVTAVDVARLRH